MRKAVPEVQWNIWTGQSPWGTVHDFIWLLARIGPAPDPISYMHSSHHQNSKCPTSHSRPVLRTSQPASLHLLRLIPHHLRYLRSCSAAEGLSITLQPQTYLKKDRLPAHQIWKTYHRGHTTIRRSFAPDGSAVFSAFLPVTVTNTFWDPLSRRIVFISLVYRDF